MSQPHLAPIAPLAPTTPESLAITDPSAEASDEKRLPVDWQSEAHAAAAADLIPLHTLCTTVCPRNSGTARGDLFEELPEYKNLHPEPAQK